MKSKLVLILLCMVGLTVTQQLRATDVTADRREDIIFGAFEDTGIRSVFPFSPEAFIEEGMLVVNFDEAVGNVEISIVNGQGETICIENNEVNAPATSSFYLGDSEKGTYTIYIKFIDFNKSLKGDFNIE